MRMLLLGEMIIICYWGENIDEDCGRCGGLFFPCAVPCSGESKELPGEWQWADWAMCLVELTDWMCPPLPGASLRQLFFFISSCILLCCIKVFGQLWFHSCSRKNTWEAGILVLYSCANFKLPAFLSWTIFLSCIKLYSYLILMFSDNIGTSGRVPDMAFPIVEVGKGGGSLCTSLLSLAVAYQLLLATLHTGISVSSRWPNCVCNNLFL